MSIVNTLEKLAATVRFDENINSIINEESALPEAGQYLSSSSFDVIEYSASQQSCANNTLVATHNHVSFNTETVEFNQPHFTDVTKLACFTRVASQPHMTTVSVQAHETRVACQQPHEVAIAYSQPHESAIMFHQPHASEVVINNAHECAVAV